MAQDKFDLQKVHDNFKKSLLDDTDIHTDAYLEGYKELYKFFHLMGNVFSFVSSDLKAKIDVLEEYRKKENADRFSTFKGMLDYEKSSALLNKSDYISASRTLLRLHRGLDFIREFLHQLGQLNGNDKTSAVCQTAYNQTLAQYHPWLIRKGAIVAMYTMPTREQLLVKVCSDADVAVQVLPDMLIITKTVYDRTHQLYHDFDLHSLA